MNSTWTYYFIEKKISKDRHIFYAYTDRKEFVKRFKAERKKKLFRFTKVDLTREQIHDLTEHRMGEYLVEFKGKTQDESGEINEFSIITTKNEELNTTSTMSAFMFNDFWEYCKVNPYEFNKKYFNILKNIHYVEAYNHINNANFSIMNFFSNHEPDLLSGFISLYGDTLEEK